MANVKTDRQTRQSQQKNTRCSSIMFKPLRIFQFVHILLSAKNRIDKSIILSCVRNFFFLIVHGIAAVRIYDLHDCYGSHAHESFSLRSLNRLIGRLRLRLSGRLEQLFRQRRLAHHSGNLRCTYTLLFSEIKIT